MKLVFFLVFVLIVLLAYNINRIQSLFAAILTTKLYFGGDPTERFGYYTADDENIEYWTCYPETKPLECYSEGLENEKDKLRTAIKNLEDDYQRIIGDVNQNLFDRYNYVLESFIEGKQLSITYGDIQNIISTHNDYQLVLRTIKSFVPKTIQFYKKVVHNPNSYNFFARATGYAEPKYQYEQLRKERINLDKQIVNLYADLEELSFSKDIIENGRDYIFLNHLFRSLNIDITTILRMDPEDILNLFEKNMNEIIRPKSEPYIAIATNHTTKQEDKDYFEISTYIAPEEQQILTAANVDGDDSIYIKYILADTLHKYYNTPDIKKLYGKLDKSAELKLDTILTKFFDSRNVPVSHSKNTLERYLNYIKKGGRRLIKDIELKRLYDTYKMSA